MPAYSFKEQFVPFVLDGSKNHTIRNYRRFQVLPGETLYLYYGLRTKASRKLKQERCSTVKTIAIGSNETVVLVDRIRLSDTEMHRVKMLLLFAHPTDLEVRISKEVGFDAQLLDDKEKNNLAWRDGFRPLGTTVNKPAGAFPMMFRFFQQTHELPFVGNIIYWNTSLQNL